MKAHTIERKKAAPKGVTFFCLLSEFGKPLGYLNITLLNVSFQVLFKNILKEKKVLILRLQTFIRLCHYDQVELASALDTILNGSGGGHNFHWSLKKAIHRQIEGAKASEIKEI
ncbi:hypothetical protein [Ruegeria profundi]|uniref:hypothetical protein n=1 Tax=Ruegeria profundi TaxID=1685378 RepID=UPI001CD22760|nr:hypothetical protein [Ruegeria profundi]MCA0930600.1 hypothetical protein [Ruegeria profundi]